MMQRSTIGTLLALGLLAAATGCGGEDGDNLEQVYAGLTTTDEAPLFGESTDFDEQALTQADHPQNDPVAGQPEFQQEEKQGIHYLFLTWGDIHDAVPPAGAPAGTARDYSGSLTVSEGGVAVLRRIRLEASQKDRVLPRTSRTLVEWKSTIYGGVDGLLFKIAAPGTATVTVTLAGLTLSRPVTELDLAHGSLELPGGAGGVVWAAVGAKAGACPRGLLVGRWHQARPSVGIFRGKWVSADGALHGHVRGLFGVRKDQNRVFFGKWVSADGAFRALLAGRYGEGKLQGHYLDGSLSLRGRLAGLYFDPRPIDAQHQGIMVGVWHDACAAEPLPAGEQPTR